MELHPLPGTRRQALIVRYRAAIKSGRVRRRTLLAVGFAAVFLLCLLLRGLHIAWLALRPPGAAAFVRQLGQIALHPAEGFGGQQRVTLLLIGVDDSAAPTNSDATHRFGNSDTLILVSFDTTSSSLRALSIPRDTYAHIAGTAQWTKINHAFALGGPEKCRDTVEELVGVRADHTLAVSMPGVERFVDLMGGVVVPVAHAMDYDDESGHLHIHLPPGSQRLNGRDALAVARYRHATWRGGVKPRTPEDGDRRRMARQQIIARALLHRAASPLTLLLHAGLADAGFACIQTDLSRLQMLDLLALLRRITPETTRTDQLPAGNFRAPDGGLDLLASPADLAVSRHWLLDER